MIMSQLNNIFFLFGIIALIGCNPANQNSVEAANNEADTTSGDWTMLFNGENLEGWEVNGGDANFYVEDGAIVGLTEEDVPNSFLVTENEYDDFVLELEFKIDPEINSGVQIRSGVYEKDTTTAYLSGKLEEGTRDWPAGRFHGYQIEIDPSDRAWTGGFYEEGGRGWLQPLTENEEAQKAFKQNEWNHLKIKADGNHFETWINGLKAADTTDDLARSGFIGLQLHSAWKDEQVGKKVWFKNIKIKEL
jgi:hypothetical protein